MISYSTKVCLGLSSVPIIIFLIASVRYFCPRVFFFNVFLLPSSISFYKSCKSFVFSSIHLNIYLRKLFLHLHQMPQIEVYCCYIQRHSVHHLVNIIISSLYFPFSTMYFFSASKSEKSCSEGVILIIYI